MLFRSRKVIIENLPFLLSDTVGFIRKLPVELVESFKSTLDEVHEADLGSIKKCEFENFGIFNLAIPKELTSVETKLLNPINTWEKSRTRASKPG